MKGNEKISFTAEAVAYMRASENSDKFSRYFISESAKKKFDLISKLIPRSYLKKIFGRRIALSEDLDKMIKKYAPEQIIELACGYSPRGLIMSLKNRGLTYIESDFSSVIDKKRDIINTILKGNKIKLSKNHHFVKIDSIGDDLEKSLGKVIDKNKKTLILSEGFVSYLNKQEHDFLIEKITSLLSKVKHGAYLGHESKFKMLNGFIGKILLFYRNVISKTKSNKHFNNAEEIKRYFQNKGFRDINIIDSKKSGNTIYLAIK